MDAEKCKGGTITVLLLAVSEENNPPLRTPVDAEI